MNIISNYIFSKLLITTVVVLGVLIGMVWLTQSLKFITIIVHHDIPITGFLKLTMFLIPDLFSSLLAISFLIAGIYVFYKLSIDHELIALHAAGTSPYQIYKPVIFVNFIVFISVLLSNIYVVPASFRQFRKFEYKIRNHFSSGLIKPGVFNFIKENMLYVQSKGYNGQLNKVFIYQQQKEKEIIIIAEKGILISIPHGYVLKLTDGQRQEKDPKTGYINQLQFENLSYNINDLITSNSQRIFKPYEKNLDELFNPEPKLDQCLKLKMLAEAHQRILSPFLVFLDGIIIALFMMHPSTNRSGHKYNFVWLFLLGFLIHGGIFSLINSSVKFSYAILLSYLSVALIYLTCIIILVKNNPYFIKSNNE